MAKPFDLTLIAAKVEPLSRVLAGPSAPCNVAEAVVLLRDVYECLASVEEVRIWLKWCLGLVINNVQSEFGSKDALIDELATRLFRDHGIRAGKSNLYECQRMCRVFDNDTPTFARWMSEMRVGLGRTPFWRDVQNALFGGRSNAAVIGREAADERDFRVAEERIDALERILVRASDGNKEALGMIEGVRQTVAGWSLAVETRPSTPRDSVYLNFVRRFGCAVCQGPAEAHHAFGYHRVSEKSSDFTSIPLCPAHHRELHNRGRRSFEMKYDFNIVEVAYNLFHRYHTGVWASNPPRRHDSRGVRP